MSQYLNKSKTKTYRVVHICGHETRSVSSNENELCIDCKIIQKQLKNERDAKILSNNMELNKLEGSYFQNNQASDIRNKYIIKCYDSLNIIGKEIIFDICNGFKIDKDGLIQQIKQSCNNYTNSHDWIKYERSRLLPINIIRHGIYSELMVKELNPVSVIHGFSDIQKQIIYYISNMPIYCDVPRWFKTLDCKIDMLDVSKKTSEITSEFSAIMNILLYSCDITVKNNANDYSKIISEGIQWSKIKYD